MQVVYDDGMNMMLAMFNEMVMVCREVVVSVRENAGVAGGPYA